MGNDERATTGLNTVKKLIIPLRAIQAEWPAGPRRMKLVGLLHNTNIVHTRRLSGGEELYMLTYMSQCAAFDLSRLKGDR